MRRPAGRLGRPETNMDEEEARVQTMRFLQRLHIAVMTAQLEGVPWATILQQLADGTFVERVPFC